MLFLSTPSARRATISSHGTQSDPYISIHALREEGDGFDSCRKVAALLFLSTPSARRATAQLTFLRRVKRISIHALREEGDRDSLDFYRAAQEISIHALREEGDRAGAAVPAFLLYFYPRPPRGGRQHRGELGRQRTIISLSLIHI